MILDEDEDNRLLWTYLTYIGGWRLRYPYFSYATYAFGDSVSQGEFPENFVTLPR